MSSTLRSKTETVVTETAGETRRLAALVARAVAPGEALGLTGPLGSGKTTFVDGFLRAFGVRDATSPTFVIAKVHPVPRMGSRARRITTVVHADLYRLPRGASLEEVGLGEALRSPNTVTLIEWADRLARLPRGAHRIRFSVRGRRRRSVRLAARLIQARRPSAPARHGRRRPRQRVARR